MSAFVKTLLLSALLSLSMVATVDARDNKGVSKNKAVSTATAKYPGKVVKISGGGKFYRVRVLQKSGRVITVKVDKKTGRIIK